MNKKELRELEFAKKTYNVIPTEEMREKVTELEKKLEKKLDIWDDEEKYNKLQKLNNLNVSDRRLLLVFSILDSSVVKTAAYFKVSQRTILNNINRIKGLI